MMLEPSRSQRINQAIIPPLTCGPHHPYAHMSVARVPLQMLIPINTHPLALKLSFGVRRGAEHSHRTMPPLRCHRLLLAVVLLLTGLPHPTHSFTELESDQIARFQEYLRIHTAHPSPDYAGAAAFLLPYAASVGLRATTLRLTPCKTKPLLLLTWPGSDPSLPSVLLNSHIDSVPAEPERWLHPPFAAHRDPATGRIYARGAQDDKCLPVQYLEAIRGLKAAGFAPTRTVHISLVPDEEIGGVDGFEKFAESEEFRALNIGFMLDEGQASPTDVFRVFYADRLVWRLIVKAAGAPGHGSRMFDGAAVDNLMDCVETIAGFREAQFGMVKAGKRGPGEVVSVNPVYMKAGIPSPTVRKVLLLSTVVTLLSLVQGP